MGLLFFSLDLLSQTANVTEGCVPTTVSFTSPIGVTPYWDFGNGANSTQANPEFIYTQAGNYTATLFQGVNGPVIGEIDITIYEDPVILINADIRESCSPATISFQSNIVLNDDIEIISYLWAFGDGGSSTDANPTYIYRNPGVYDVSLEIQTNILECDFTEVFNEYMTILGTRANFTMNKEAECEFPATFAFGNQSETEPGNTYFWDFGNGNTSNNYNPGNQIYDVPNEYTVSLTVTDIDGCVSVRERNIVVGNPVFRINAPDTACINEPFFVSNFTIADSCRWTLPSDADFVFSEDSVSIALRFLSPGQKVFNLSCMLEEDCRSDTTFNIFIENPTAAFTIDPLISCQDEQEISVSAEDQTYREYLWNFDSNQNSPNASFTRVCPVRDTVYEEVVDTLWITLNAITHAGCFVADTMPYVHLKPTARILANFHEGCAPLNVTFRNLVTTHVPLIFREWTFGDGSPSEQTDSDTIQHTFQEPGEYFVKLSIENADGCEDISNGIWVHVGEPITPEYTLDRTEICLGETVNVDFLNTDPRIDGLIFATDGERYSDCWDNQMSSHTFTTEPGTFDATFTVDYNGCYTNIVEEDAIKVNGSKANISYMINCDSSHQAMIMDSSLNADTYVWLQDSVEILGSDQFTIPFDSAGVYEIRLITSNSQDNCPESIDSIILNITDLEAVLDLPDQMCFNLEYNVSALNSTGVDNDCHEGYLYNMPGRRPRLVDKDSVNHTFPPGIHEVSLTVQDINGCTDVDTKTVEVFGLEPSFEPDSIFFCDPTLITFNNTTESDTTIVDWLWSFGSTEENPTHLFENLPADTAIVTLTAIDAIGCEEVFGIKYPLYVPEVSIEINTPGVCTGESVEFDVINGNPNVNLEVEWDFGGFGIDNNFDTSFTFDEAGDHVVYLNYVDADLGCSGTDSVVIQVVETPIADFTATVLGELFEFDRVLCAPQILDFRSTSMVSGFVNTNWYFDNDPEVSGSSPSYSFESGTHNIEMIVESIFGCADTISREVTLIGPQGTLTADKDEICFGDEVTFTVSNLSEVNRIEWNSGNGTVVQGGESVTFTYDQLGQDPVITADVILSSTDSGCEIIESIDINVIQVVANFLDTVTNDICGIRAEFTNVSEGGVEFNWDFGNGESSSSEDPPTVFYEAGGTYTVTLEVSDANNLCTNTLEKTFIVEESEEEFTMPNVFSPNADMVNDNFNYVIPDFYEDIAEVVTFRIYNRWGELIYNNENPSGGWNGFYKNEAAPPDVYAYYIELAIQDCGTVTKKGNVTLVK